MSNTPFPPWRLLRSAVRFENKTMRLREDSVVLPDGTEMEYAFVERGKAVILVPITEAGEMVLIRQYRHPVAERCLEVPAGTARDTSGLSLEEVAAKELKEEVGGTGKTFELVASFFSNSALSDEECHVFLVTDVVLAAKPKPEPSEDLKTMLLPVVEAVALVERGEMKTGPSALAVLLTVPLLRSRGII